MRSLYWVRNDLRLHDNSSLNDFCARSAQGVFIWCPTPSFFRADVFRRSFILASLQEFKNQIEKRGGTFLIFQEPAEVVIPELVRKHKFEALFWTSEPAFEEKREEQRIRERVSAEIFVTQQGSLIHTDDLPFALNSTPSTFTSYRKKVEAHLIIRLESPSPTNFPNCEIQEKTWFIDETFKFHSAIQPGEEAALARLNEYFWEQDRLMTYKETRNGLLDWNDSSKLSPYLSIGLLSPRRVYNEIQRYQQERVNNESTYWLFFEMLWRDYFRLQAEKLQQRLFVGNTHQDARDRVFENWCAGKSGDDFVDANMRELNLTGWMSNRGRQNVASYLAKTLQIDWRLGAAYFEKKLIDYDVSSNWGNWAYLAGVGQDPRDRTFNTSRQSEMYDPGGTYRMKWLRL